MVSTLSNQRSPFKILYNPVPPFDITYENTALMISDLQRLTVNEKGGISRLAQLKGVSSEFKYYYESIQNVVENTRSILKMCRQIGFNVIFTRIASKISDGTDIGRNTSIWNKTFPYNPEDATLILQPDKRDIVLDKVCDNPFNCTKLERLLINLGIKYIIICGVRTPGYLNVIAFDAADRGFGVIVVSDACTGGVLGGTRNLTGGLLRNRSTRSVLEILEQVRKEDLL